MSAPSVIPWIEDEPAFLRELGWGRRGEFKVAVELLDAGLSVRVGQLELRDGPANRDQFIDQIDIEVNGRDLLEIKSRRFSFTGPQDYPYESAYVGATRRWLYRPRPPCAVVVYSEPTGGKVVASAATRDQWVKETKYLPARRFFQENYACPRALLLPWDPFLAWLKR